jgi:non-specific serine/threonine protein kinase
LTFAKAAEPELQSVQQATWMERAEQEIDNLRTVLAGLAQESPEDALRMAFDLFWFWESSRYLREGYDWLVTLTSQPALPPTALQAEAYAVTGFLAFGLNRVDEVPALLAKSQTIYRTLDRADPRIATGYARLLSYLGLVPLSQGDYARVVALNRQALEIARRVGATWQAARALFYMGEAYWMQGRLGEAKANFEESLRLGRETGNLRGYARRIMRLGLIACTQGGLQEAVDRGREALTICAACKDRSGVAQTLLVMAQVAHSNDRHPRAARLLAAIETLNETNPIGYSFPAFQREYACALTTAREKLDDSVFSALWAEGRALSMEQAVAYALSDEG